MEIQMLRNCKVDIWREHDCGDSSCCSWHEREQYEVLKNDVYEVEYNRNAITEESFADLKEGIDYIILQD